MMIMRRDPIRISSTEIHKIHAIHAQVTRKNRRSEKIGSMDPSETHKQYAQYRKVTQHTLTEKQRQKSAVKYPSEQHRTHTQPDKPYRSATANKRYGRKVL
jgi:hypothetical protein